MKILILILMVVALLIAKPCERKKERKPTVIVIGSEQVIEYKEKEL